MKAADLLPITWASRTSLHAALEAGPPPRYVVPAPPGEPFPEAARVGRLVLVEMRFADDAVSFRHHARVVEHRRGAGEAVTLEFLPEEQAVYDLIACYAAGEAVPYFHRRRERVPVRLLVMLHVGTAWRPGFLTDLSEQGAYVSLPDPPPPRTRVVLTLTTPTQGRLEIRGRTVSRQGEGPRPGCGVEFLFASPQEEERVAEQIRALVRRPQPSSR
ncbi:MAG: PilZ domain-containing protein [Deltaproteobacteria bacterium]|nr:PilZ domain-containing protein [Deltaproteobacteria bacterium]